MKTASENVIRLLAKAIADARAGSIDAVLIVTATPEGMPDAQFAGDVELMPTINMGVDMGKAAIIAQVSATIMQHATQLRRAAGNLDG